MGKPKQLLAYNAQSFLQHMIDVITHAGLQPVLVVLGANASTLISEPDGDNTVYVMNDACQEGIASSIRCGINALQKKYIACDGALLMVCDQPYITSALLNELINTQKQSLKPIAACTYENIIGTPAVFHKTFFPDLLSLKGDKGAGKILQQRPDAVATLDFPMGRFDIDTPEDYDAWLKSFSG
ncbi:MAG: MobA-like protein-like protein [Chitinophagaceae bacterium]|nr:MobA-like protein-like protein [Chitinophagaceae bacterium]